MRMSIVTVAFVLGLQGLALPAGAADQPAQPNRAASEMNQTSAEKIRETAPQPMRVAEDVSADKSFDRQVSDETKDSGRAKPIRVYFFFGGR